MDTEDLKYWLALHSVDGIGAATWRKLLDRFGDPSEMFRASAKDIAALPRITEAKAAEILQAHARIPEMERLIPQLDDAGIDILTIRDEGYPKKLLELKNPPVMLYIYGQIKPEDARSIAVVGSRDASERGLEIARGFGQRLAQRGFTIVSGYAPGIDTAGHLGALEGGGRTIMVLGTGIFHFKLRDAGFESFEFLKARGAVISENFPTMTWTVGAAMARNRIVVALSQAVLVVECRPEGGTMNTAQVTREMGRQLFVLNYQADDDHTAGNRMLIESGAIPIFKYGDVAMMERAVNNKSEIND